ncbi:MAG: transcriptional repressor, partial [Candidatus Omnitrophica bacterium]|nr:transcriptional repressor [Candidatus Omnitrophota bacterium]
MNTSSNKLTREKERFLAYLNSNGIKVTPGRTKVFNNAMNMHGHFNAEELAKTSLKNDCVSRATVYRTLREMLEAGIIRETAFGDKHHHFE